MRRDVQPAFYVPIFVLMGLVDSRTRVSPSTHTIYPPTPPPRVLGHPGRSEGHPVGLAYPCFPMFPSDATKHHPDAPVYRTAHDPREQRVHPSKTRVTPNPGHLRERRSRSPPCPLSTRERSPGSPLPPTPLLLAPPSRSPFSPFPSALPYPLYPPRPIHPVPPRRTPIPRVLREVNV